VIHINYEKERFFDFIDVPEKYIELAEIAAPDTPVNGYDERQVYAYSKDRLAYRHIRLALIEEQMYVITSSGFRYIHGYPLRDEEMNQYIIDMVFISITVVNRKKSRFAPPSLRDTPL